MFESNKFIYTQCNFLLIQEKDYRNKHLKSYYIYNPFYSLDFIRVHYYISSSSIFDIMIVKSFIVSSQKYHWPKLISLGNLATNERTKRISLDFSILIIIII